MHEINSLIFFFLVIPPHTTTANETLTRLSDSLEKLCNAWIVFFSSSLSSRSRTHCNSLSWLSHVIYYPSVGLSSVSDWLNYNFWILIKDISACWRWQMESWWNFRVNLNNFQNFMRFQWNSMHNSKKFIPREFPRESGSSATKREITRENKEILFKQLKEKKLYNPRAIWNVSTIEV